MEQRKHWWNGKWGRLGRKDVYLRVSGDQWYVEQRTGGGDGVSHFFEFDGEDAALDTVRALLGGLDDEWRELSVRPSSSF
jgi:hypothetical protein